MPRPEGGIADGWYKSVECDAHDFSVKATKGGTRYYKERGLRITKANTTPFRERFVSQTSAVRGKSEKGVAARGQRGTVDPVVHMARRTGDPSHHSEKICSVGYHKPGDAATTREAGQPYVGTEMSPSAV